MLLFVDGGPDGQPFASYREALLVNKIFIAVLLLSTPATLFTLAQGILSISENIHPAAAVAASIGGVISFLAAARLVDIRQPPRR